MKYIYVLKDGKRTTVSAKTRSWEKAEAHANEIRDSWNPIKQKLRELERQQQAMALKGVLVEQAIERWLLSLRSDFENDYTYRKYETAA